MGTKVGQGVLRKELGHTIEALWNVMDEEEGASE